jgi:hypothetical protein
MDVIFYAPDGSVVVATDVPQEALALGDAVAVTDPDTGRQLHGTVMRLEPRDSGTAAHVRQEVWPL